MFAGAADVLPYVEADLKKIAGRVVGKAHEICASKSVTAIYINLIVITAKKKLKNIYIEREREKERESDREISLHAYKLEPLFLQSCLYIMI